MASSDLALFAVFLTGFLGGVHCAGMCGGIVSALGMLRQRPVSNIGDIPVGVFNGSSPTSAHTVTQPSAIASISLYNFGRISMYTFLGSLAGGVGSVVWLMDSMLPVQQIAYLISNILSILMGLYILGIKKIAVIVEALGARLWEWVRPAATRRLAGAGVLNSVLAGALWGMVPCGMVYAVLSAALVSGGAGKGALLMLVFGLGTLPNLMLLGLSGQWLARFSRNRAVRLFAGSMIMAFGGMGLLHLCMMLSQ
ncbi:MAG: sulfite exporter TauE/SafE family protein [Granulosicoccus sp.]